MRDYLLFIDTEGSGWPKNWNAPYSKKNNWPYSLQISWLVYTKDGKELKRENHYINDDVKIEDTSFKIHGITHEFLKAHGENRKDVMTRLAEDITTYRPLLVGHFMELDLHMIGADFYRSGMTDPTAGLPVFCTMKGTAEYAGRSDRKYFRLGELYSRLFAKAQPDQHNALADAKAAADCFFELVLRGEIDDKAIDAQQETDIKIPGQRKNNLRAIFAIVFLIIIVTAIIIYSWMRL